MPVLALLVISWAGLQTARGPGQAELITGLEAFLDARLRQDEEAALIWLTKSARHQFTRAGEPITGTANPHWTYFAVLGWKGNEAIVAAHEGYSGVPYASYREERLAWGKVGGEWRIVRARFSPRYTLRASQDGTTLFFATDTGTAAPGQPDGDGKWQERQESISPTVVLRLTDLPAEFTPAGASPEVRFGVGRARFGPLAFAPADPSRFAFSSSGVHGFVGLASRQGFERGLDLYFEGDVVEIRWSPQGQYLLVDVLEPSGQVVTFIYDVVRGTRLPVERIRAYPAPIPPELLSVSRLPAAHRVQTPAPVFPAPAAAF
ncbi:MAG: hypothetical protein IMX00_00395 [Limnochordales bacterium]|nr:hypothetical protein [Limnochordales bacterium]